jgi:hypothetical protein
LDFLASAYKQWFGWPRRIKLLLMQTSGYSVSAAFTPEQMGFYPYEFRVTGGSMSRA